MWYSSGPFLLQSVLPIRAAALSASSLSSSPSYPSSSSSFLAVSGGSSAALPSSFSSWSSPSPSVQRVNVSVLLPGLLSAASYWVCCSTDDFSPQHPLPLALAQDSCTLTSLQGQRDILPLSRPPAVVYQYVPGDNLPEQLFRFRLTAQPIGQVSVTVRLTFTACEGIRGRSGYVDAAAVPDAFLFDEYSLSLELSFYVRSSVTGCFNYTVSGQGYLPFVGSLYVRNVRISPEPPSLSEAVFATDGTSIVLSFDRPTDQGLSSNLTSSGGFNCSDLFSIQWISPPNSNAVHDARALCVWQSDLTVIMTSSVCPPGGNITLLPGKVRSACESTTFACSLFPSGGPSSTQVRVPPRPDLPVVVLLAPQVVSACDELLLDPTGSYGTGGRPWSLLEWSSFLIQTGPNVTVLSRVQDHLNQQYPDTRTRAVIPARLLWPGMVLDVVLRVTNFLGQTALGKVRVQVTAQLVPQVRIFQEKQAGSGMLSFSSEVDMPTCPYVQVASSPALTYTWKLYADLTYLTAIVSTSRDPRRYVVPLSALPYSWPFSYMVQLEVRLAGLSPGSPGPLLAATALSVDLDQPTIVPIIAGADMQTFSDMQTIPLDASKSYQTAPGDLTYTYGH